MENKFIRADDVAQELSVSKPYAYKLIRKLNEELKAQGFITIAGRVNRQYTSLIIIDTLQKVREVGGDNYSYANDRLLQ